MARSSPEKRCCPPSDNCPSTESHFSMPHTSSGPMFLPFWCPSRELSRRITIFANAVHADELLSIMLHLGPHGSDNALRVAGVFMAINKSARRLRQLYDIDLPGVRTPSQQKTKALWPNPIANPPECTERPLKLEFFSKVNRPNRTELSFIYSDNERHAMYLPCTMQTRTSNQVVFCQVCHQVS